MIMITFNLMVGLIMDSYSNKGVYDTDRLNTHIQVTEEYTENVKDPGTLSKLKDSFQVQIDTWGNPIKMSYDLVILFIKGLLVPITDFDTQSDIEQALVNIFRLMIGMFNVIIGLELYLVFKANKAT